MTNEKHFTDDLIDAIGKDDSLSDDAKTTVMKNIQKLRNTKVNILITGATGCGKSSTINGLFGSERAKVGQGVNPQTMDIQKYEYSNIILWDSPGLGDGTEIDNRHSKNIIDKLYEKDGNGDVLIDLVLVILNGSTRDLGTSYTLINQVIIPNLGEDKKRLLVAINRADMAMDGDYWSKEKNCPEQELINFLGQQVISIQTRIKASTGIDVEPIYYSAGRKRGNLAQNPYNLSKLLLFILRHTKQEKRAVFAQDINKDQTMWKDDDRLENYSEAIKKTWLDSVVETIGDVANVVGDVLNVAVDIGGAISRGLSKVRSWLPW